MIQFCNYIPIINNESYLFNEDSKNGSFKFVSRMQLELNYITINSTAKLIMNLCRVKIALIQL